MVCPSRLPTAARRSCAASTDAAFTVEVRPSGADSSGAGGDSFGFEVQQRFPGGVAFGLLTLDGTEVLYALDGQHRLKSVTSGALDYPDEEGGKGQRSLSVAPALPRSLRAALRWRLS